MSVDLKASYAMMLRSRLFEEQVQALWEQGLISGEMHMSIGEDGIAAGVVSLLQEDDALAAAWLGLLGWPRLGFCGFPQSGQPGRPAGQRERPARILRLPCCQAAPAG